MNNTETAALLAYITGADRRNYTPATNADRAAMIQSWTQILPAWITPGMAKTAVDEHYRESRYPIMPADLIAICNRYRQEIDAAHRRSQGITATVNDTGNRDTSDSVPMPESLKQQIRQLKGN